MLGALSVAFAPANTKQALTAAHTIVTGWQSNIDSDILAKSSIGTYAHAIKVGYMGDIQTYIKDQLDTFDATKKSYSAEVARIAIIHHGCSLGSAQDSINANLGVTADQKQQNNNPGQTQVPATAMPGANPRAPVGLGFRAPTAPTTVQGGSYIIPGHPR